VPLDQRSSRVYCSAKSLTQLSVKFFLVGKTEDAPDAVPIEYLQQQQSQSFRWLGWRNDVRELMAISDIITLPSCYPEGVPRSLLEAMAMEKPIVTTDNIGCREVVEHGRNGFLVPTKDERLLATASKRCYTMPLFVRALALLAPQS